MRMSMFLLDSEMEAVETATSIVTIPQDGLELIRFAHTFLSMAEAIAITTPEEAQAAVDQAKRVKAFGKELLEYRMERTKPLDEEKAAWIEAFRPATEVVARAEQLLKGAYSVWDAEQKRLAAEEDKRRREQEAAERKRQEEEQAAAAQLLQQADEAASRGDLAQAQALEEQAAAAQQVAAPVVLPVSYAAPKARGASSRTIWKCKVINPALVPAPYLMPNQALLDALAATAKGAGDPPAGCEWVSSSSVSLR